MTSSKRINSRKRIALVVQDKYKAELINWAYYNKHLLAQHELIATGFNAGILSGTLNVHVKRLADGPLGGYQQLDDLMRNSKVDIIIFFVDPLETESAYEEMKTLQAVAESYNIVIAPNRVSADFIINSSYMDSEHPGYGNDDSGYQRRREVVLIN